MKKNSSIILIVIALLIIYSFAYFYVKYKYCAVRPESFTASVFNKEERIIVVLFYSKSKFDVAVYYIFLPMSKLEKIFDKEFIYEINDVRNY